MPLLECRPPDKEKATLGGAAFKSNLQKKLYKNQQNKQGKFNRSVLPVPSIVLKKLSITSSNFNHAGFFVLRCPFHNGGQEIHPSLNLHATSGHYKCHACGAKGGDVLAFYMAVTGKSFEDAARDLGAWRVGI